MLRKLYQLPLLLLLLLFTACSYLTPLLEGEGTKITGTITYDRVPVKVDYANAAALDYDNTYRETSKYIVVKALNKEGQVVAETTTNNKGQYKLYVPENTDIKIRAYARMLKKDVWDVVVVDNTNLKSMYVIEGNYHNSGTQSNERDLHASSGWDGQSYSATRSAAPFAILDSISTIMQKAVQADEEISFPQLTINWSTNNVSAGGDPSFGQIGTSSYTADNGEMWILGDANADTDEYDDHIIIHEWAHFFEDQFSRSDSIGGGHSAGDALDIRVAFGEGFGNAMSAIATDDPIYFDTSGYNQSSGWSMNVESGHAENPGWFSEASIQRILYDLYDDNNDGLDTISLGFAPLYNTMIKGQRNTKAFTSIFTFINALKSENSSDVRGIDQVVSSESINIIHDAYGSNISNRANGVFTVPLYRTLPIGRGVTQCNKNTYGVYNKLRNRTFMRVNIPQSGVYTFAAQPYGASYGDPDIVLYNTSYPYDIKGMSPLEGQNSDAFAIELDKGDYMLEAYDNSFGNSCYTITLTKGFDATKMNKLNKSSISQKSTIETRPLETHRQPERRPLSK